MPYALDAEARPLFLISRLAVHTQNLETDRRASLLVAESTGAGDPLAAARVTVLGEVVPAPPADLAPARTAYLACHPTAAYWVDFEDFAFHRLEVTEVYFVGGFAAMGWVDAAAFRAARPDPLAEAATGILEHMNRDHADALVTLARGLGGTPADHATMTAVDRLGFRLRVRAGDRLHGTRIAFPREVRTPEAVRAVLIEMLAAARARAAP
jgi:putative heme iron utilization protein